MTDTELKYLIGSECGMLSGNLYKIPNRSFMPAGLVQIACQAEALTILGASTYEIESGSIHLTESGALRGALGEFFERYCASFYNPSEFRFTSFRDLKSEGHQVLSPEHCRLYSDDQYNTDGFLFKKWEPEDQLNWVEGINPENGEPVMIPAFLTFYPFHSKEEPLFMSLTTTGLAAGPDFEKAISSGFLECAERHCFSRFWYLQQQHRSPLYSSDLILNHFGDDSEIRSLFDNPYIRFGIYNIGAGMPVDAWVVFMYFTYKDKCYQSVGCSARFDRKSALKKACLEAYQGVDYAIMLDQKKTWGESEEAGDFSKVTNFDRHFAYYNRFPEIRERIPLVTRILQQDFDDALIPDDTCPKAESFEEILSSPEVFGVGPVYAKELTTEDARTAGFHVARVIVPGYALLSGDFSAPFLGGKMFGRAGSVYLDWPHPFP